MPCCLLCHDHVALSATLPCLALPWLLALPCITLPRGRFAARAHSSRDRDHNAQRPSAPWPRRLRRAPRDETTLKKVWGSSMVYSKQQLGYDGGSGACLRAGKSGPAGRRGGGATAQHQITPTINNLASCAASDPGPWCANSDAPPTRRPGRDPKQKRGVRHTKF